jgi:flagellar motor switch/type III secretory pathway protein FliN
MVTTTEVPQRLEDEHREPKSRELSATAVEEALVPVLGKQERALMAITGPLTLLPVQLEVAIPIRNFRVRNLLALARDQIIETQWCHSEDLPLSADDVQLAWSEFEVMETALCVRLTRLA